MTAMHCEFCEKENSPEVISRADREVSSGSAAETEPAAPQPQKKLKSHMTAAILTTIFFGNWIFGIPAIVFAKECETAALGGQTEIAERFSRRALTFLSVGSALSLAVLSFAVLVITVVTTAAI